MSRFARGGRRQARPEEHSRGMCAGADVGITSADFALADTGTLVFLTESGESTADFAAASRSYRGD